MKVGCRLGKHFVGSAKHGGILLEEAVLHSLTKYIQGKELDASVHSIFAEYLTTCQVLLETGHQCPQEDWSATSIFEVTLVKLMKDLNCQKAKQQIPLLSTVS